MKKTDSISMIVLLVIITFLLIPCTGYSIYFGKGSIKQAETKFAPGRLIVKLKPEVDKKVVLSEVRGIITTGVPKFDEFNTRFSVIKQEKLFKEFKKTALKSDKFSSVYILEVPQETDLKQMKTEYESLAEVEYAELDYKVELFQEPNDPLFPHQWSLNNLGLAQNNGQGYYGIKKNGDHNMMFGTEDADIDALEAFQRGDETTAPLVGIIDTGLDLDHEDLADNIWKNPGEIPDDSIDNDHNGFVDDVYGWDFSGDATQAPLEIIEDNDPTDCYGHGTHCAGIVGAVRNNGIGISGINSPCKIMAIKIFWAALTSVCTKGIIYAADMGCDVINMSWGGPFYSRLMEDALDYVVSKGVLPVAAAGNSGYEDYFYPAALPQVLTVGASNDDDFVTDFSTYGNHIEVVAPGMTILSLRADTTDMYAELAQPLKHIVHDKYYLANGTSMASPCVVGVAAYILAASPGITTQRVKEIIQESADDLIDPCNREENLPGWDIYSGYGRVNLNSALQLLSGRLAKIDYPYDNAIVSGEIAILGTASGDSFHNYVLEYGEGYSPGIWTTIASSLVPVSKDTLGIWNTVGLTGRYTLRLSVGDENQEIVRVVAGNNVRVEITSPSHQDSIKGYVEVYGFTVVPDFSHYTLEYGYGASPTDWDTIITSTRIAAEDLLATWQISFLQQGNYTLRLTAKTDLGETFSDSIVIFAESIASNVWVQELPSFPSLSPAVGDIDGDGYDEIVVGIGGPPMWPGTGGIWVFTHDGQLESGWPKDTAYNMMSSPALGDLDNDGIDDIVICSQEQGIHAYLSSSPDWVRSAATGEKMTYTLVSPIIADLEDDGDLEVLVADDSGTVYAWRNDGESVIPGNDGIFVYRVFGSDFKWAHYPYVAVADLDKDGDNEVIGGLASCWGYPGHYTGFGGIYIWDIQGNTLLDTSDYPDKFTHIHGIAIANLDENEDLEIVAFGENEDYNTLSVFKKDGSQIPNFPIILEDLEAGWWSGNNPAVGDLEGDGILEIVVSIWEPGEARMYAWHQDGTPLGSIGSEGLLVSMKSPDSEKKKEILSSLGNDITEVLTELKNMSNEERSNLLSTFEHDPVFASMAETFGSPVLADVNADGEVDIIARAGYYHGNGYERIYAWDYEGNLIPGFPLYATEEPAAGTWNPYSPVIADLDKNGELDMVLATDWPYYTIVHLELDTYYGSIYGNWHRCWPEYMHDRWNSGIYGKVPFSGYDISYAVCMINYLFKGGPPPDPLEYADVNCDGDISIADVVYLINYLFKGGPPPC